MPTTDQLQAELDALKARVNVIDGQGLSDPSLAILTVLANAVAGVKNDLGQVTLTFEGILDKLQSTVNGWIATLQSHLNS